MSRRRDGRLLTRTIRGIPTEVRLGPSDGLSRIGVANADEIATIPMTLIRDRITTLGREKLDEAIRFALDLAE